MKRCLAAACAALVMCCMLVVALAAEPELRPSQKLMKARAGWLNAMNENLAGMKYAEVKADALALSAQAKTVAEKQEAPLAKELTLKVATLAGAAAAAADAKDAAKTGAALVDIKATCSECHAKIRDKK